MNKKNFVNFFDWNINYDVSPKKLKSFSDNYDKILLKKNKVKIIKFSFFLSKKIIKKFYARLNKLTKSSLSYKQWEFILLHWCFFTVCHSFTLWNIIEKSKRKKFKLFDTNINDVLKRPEEFKPSSKVVNNWMLKKILDFKNIKYSVSGKINYSPIPIHKKSVFKRTISKLFSILNLFFPSRVLLVDTGLNFVNELFLNIKLKQAPIYFDLHDFKINNVDKKLRHDLKIKVSKKKKFENFFEEIFPEILPNEFLESFNYYLNFPQKNFWPEKNKFKMIVTQSISSSIKRIMFSKYMGKKNCLIILQHGGGYGIAKMHLAEMVESYLGNKFLTWGWEEKKGKKHPFISMKISQLKNKTIKNISKSKIVFFISSYTKFFQKIGFYPSTNYQTILQFRYITNIVDRLKKDLKNKLTLRYSKYGFDRGGLEFPKNLFDKNINYDGLMQPFYKSVNKNTLTIHDNINNSTAWIETLALNIPTIIFADVNTNDVRTSFVKTFKLLKKNNIVFTDTLSLSNFVNNNFENLNDWWNSKKIQDARLITINKYARIHKKPVEYLKKRIIKEIKKIN